ncbi:MAG: HD domain-containing protein [Bacteroidetes bacterium]|nr:HD domain-containing protein [Bacteroidota bacterium]
MNDTTRNKRKILNDPVHGFIGLPNDLIFDIIEHPYFQRLRRIMQLGLTHLVYPGALHTRFSHALGSMHLMMEAIEVLRQKGQVITDEEAIAANTAILLHDIGHGPFSHALEHSLVESMSHEDISEIFMDCLNEAFDGQLTMALDIFKGNYPKKFLHQLVSGQLDVDRLDYLTRDSFFTGVSEGIIGTERIIKMLNVWDGELVVDIKGIYSIEKFLVSRRLMYWQVYLHKTVLSAEQLMIKILKRAKQLSQTNIEVFATPALSIFLKNNYQKKDFIENKSLIEVFSQLDDFDIFSSIKVWQRHDDKILSKLSENLVNRNLYKIELQNKPFSKEIISELKEKISRHYNISDEETDFFVFTTDVVNNAYDLKHENINILLKNNVVKDITEASDQLNAAFLDKIVKKYLLCYPKECYLL